MKKLFSLEEFRIYIKELYIPKGITPPEEGSKREMELYEQWVKGREILENKEHDF